MTDRSKFVFTSQGMPARYDDLLVPRMFGPWGEALVETVRPAAGTRALDIATGPGTVARILARAIGPNGQVAACDSSPPMIARAEQKPEVVRGAPIAYTVAPAAPLPYPDDSFTVATCQQGLQFFPDVRAALGEACRVVTAGGRFAASVWHPLTECVIFKAYAEALTLAGLDELADLMTVPFPLWTDADLADRARTAGFRSVNVTTERRVLEFPGGIEEALMAVTGTPIGPMLEALDLDARARLAAAAATCLAPLLEGGAVRGIMTARVLVAKN